MPKLKATGTIHNTLTGFDFTQDKALSLAKSIRFKCLECQNGSATNVRRCHITDCPLWPRRMGRPLRSAEKGAHLESYSGDYPQEPGSDEN